MDQEQMNRILLDALVKSQADLLALKDLIIEDIAMRQATSENLIKPIQEAIEKSVNESRKVYVSALTAQIKNEYLLGGTKSVDDLLKDL